MSKQDYQKIAAAVYRARATYADNPQHGEYAQAVLGFVAAELADILRADNSRFDRERFREACETGKCKGMRQVSA